MYHFLLVFCLLVLPLPAHGVLVVERPVSVYYSQGLADNTVIAKVNGQLYDLDRPLEEDAKLELLKFDSDEGEWGRCTETISSECLAV